MRFTLELDLWDAGALVALAAVLVGLFAWHWPAGLVAVGASYLWLYYHRERNLHAAKPPAQPTPPEGDGAGGE